MTLDQYLDYVVDVLETGVYTNNPWDSGGPTRWGITQKTLSAWRGKIVSTDDVKNLSRDEAKSIYLQIYVKDAGFFPITQTQLQINLVDAGINTGVQSSSKMLQRSLNVLNRNGGDWPDLKVDGHVGTMTRSAINALQNIRGDAGILLLRTVFGSLLGSHYVEISESNAKNEEFTYGWFSNRVMLQPRDFH